MEIAASSKYEIDLEELERLFNEQCKFYAIDVICCTISLLFELVR